MSDRSDNNKELEKGNPLTRPDSNMDEQLRQVMTNTMSISPEIFEKLYLSPKTAVKGDLRKTFANPTPLGVMGFAVGLTPLSIEYMGWRGAGGGTGDASATVGATIWFGGMLLLIAGALEFILGNTFPFVVFMGYGAHFLTLGVTFIPYYNAVAAYAPPENPAELTPPFTAGLAFYTLSLCILSFIFLICSLRTNGIFVLVFITATIGFGMASGAFWSLAQGNMALGGTLLIGTGGCFFAASMLGWYLFAALMLVAVDMPGPSLPVFDLSNVIKGKTKSE